MVINFNSASINETIPNFGDVCTCKWGYLNITSCYAKLELFKCSYESKGCFKDSFKYLTITEHTVGLLKISRMHHEDKLQYDRSKNI